MRNVKTGTAILTAAVALSLAVVLAGCAGQQSGSSGAAPSSEASASASASAPTAADIASWKTLGDALPYKTGYLSWGYDDEYFIGMFPAGDSVIRTVSKMDPDVRAGLVELDVMADDYDEQAAAVLGALELISAEDVSADLLSQEELDAYIGKTGQDMFADGFECVSYFFYGGPQTGADMDRGYFSYAVTFDVSVAEPDNEDGGAAIKDAKVTELMHTSYSNAALDPTCVG